MVLSASYKTEPTVVTGWKAGNLKLFGSRISKKLNNVGFPVSVDNGIGHIDI